MKRIRTMGYLAAAVLSLHLSACQSFPASPNTGAIRFQFALPASAASSLDFRLQAVPAGTSGFEIEVSGAGLSAPLKQTLALQAGQSQSKTISALPVGPKQVTVKAMLDQEVLASATTQVTIIAGEVARADLELQALKAAVTAELETVLPLDLQLKMKLSGDGLTPPQEKTITIPANQTSVALGALPLGSKQAQIEMSVQGNGQSASAPAIDSSFSVTATGGKVSIPANQVLSAFSDKLEGLLGQANPLVLLAWIQKLQSNPARLRELFFLLPPAVRQRLRDNPLVSGSLPAESDAGSVASSPAPAASDEPAPAAETSQTFGLLADSRLALSAPADPDALMTQPAANSPGEVRVLKPDDVILLGARSLWGLLMRTSYSGFDTVPYQVRVRRANGDQAQLLALQGTMSRRYKLNGENFVGEVLTFGNQLSLTAGVYDVAIDLRDPDSGKLEMTRYRIRVL